MPLERDVDGPVEELHGAIRFAMRDGAQVVPCLVTSAALMRIAGSDDYSPIRAFAAHRHKIEVVAAAKYYDGRTEADGGIVLLPIDFP